VVDEILPRIWDQLVGRLSGPMSVRFVIQPAVAVTLAIRAGVRDARDGRPPYLRTLIVDSSRRRTMLLSGWVDIKRLFVLAAGFDILYQIEVLRFFHPLQALTVACSLAVMPYVAIRGLASRAMTAYRRRSGR
jgi:hypothetical protein